MNYIITCLGSEYERLIMRRIHWITKIIVLLLICEGVFVTSLFAQDISSIYRDAKRSIVLIVAYDNNGSPLGMGTGFYFKTHLIATNYHVVEGASSFHIKNIGSGKQFKSSKVKSYSEKLDIALIKTEEPAQPILIAKGKEQNIGEKVIVIGNPRGLEGSVSAGIISGIRPVAGFNVYQLTAPISPGSSGGPVFNSNGEVLGIATFTIRESQNLNFAMPARLLAELENKEMKWEPAPNIEAVYKKANAGIKLVLFAKAGHELNETISLKNTTQNTIKNLTLILFYKTVDGEQFDYRIVSFDETLPPGIAKMKTIPSFDQEQNFMYHKTKGTAYERNYYTLFSVEMSVLSYDIAEENQTNILDTILK